MERYRAFGSGLGAAAMSVAVGLFVLSSLGAPRSYLILNGAGLAVSALVGALLLVRPQFTSRALVFIALAGGAAVLLTAFAGVPLEGIRRWVRAGPVLLHVGMIALPFVLGQASRQVSWPSLLGVALALAGAALQPDAAVASALAAGAVAIAILRPSPQAWALAALAAAVMVWCWTRPDPLPAVTYVEGVVPLAFDASAIVGVTACVGLALPALALIAFGLRNPQARPTAIALGAASAGLAVASLVGKYPTPIVGYGLSPILSYVLCWAVLASASGAEPPSDRLQAA